MQLPENVVPMPAEQRAELKYLASQATPGPWKVAPTGHVYTGDGRAPLHVVWLLKDNCRYIAALPPDVALDTLAYVEAVEADNAKLAVQLAEARQELADQEADKLLIVQENQRLQQQVTSYRGIMAARAANLDWAMSAERKALWAAEHALANCYDVTEWPANGQTEADRALTQIRKLLYPTSAALVDMARAMAEDVVNSKNSPAPLPLQGEAGPGQVVGSITIPEGFDFVARWPTSRVDLATMAALYGEDARCCAPGPNGGLPLIIRPKKAQPYAPAPPLEGKAAAEGGEVQGE
jgi:hypothetical protein